MEAKKRLARTIVADFHGAEAAQQADADWARQFQQKEMPENVRRFEGRLQDHVSSPQEIEGFLMSPGSQALKGAGPMQVIRLPKLLVDCGLAKSNSEAERKIKEKSVQINGQNCLVAKYPITRESFIHGDDGKLQIRLDIRLGKQSVTAILQ
jgi:tyrosyl-tRNA synthetase